MVKLLYISSFYEVIEIMEHFQGTKDLVFQYASSFVYDIWPKAFAE